MEKVEARTLTRELHETLLLLLISGFTVGMYLTIALLLLGAVR